MGKFITVTLFTGFFYAFAAHAQGGNLVSVLKDANNNEKTLQIRVSDPTDVQAFAQTFPEPLSLSDRRSGLNLEFACAADHCTFNFETREKRYGQRFDEAIRSIESFDRAVTFPLWEAMRTEVQVRECVRADTGCVEFKRKAISTRDGRFNLDCVRRRYDDHRGQYEIIDCEAIYSLSDLHR